MSKLSETMKKFLPLFFISLIIVSCTNSTSSSSAQPEQEQQPFLQINDAGTFAMSLANDSPCSSDMVEVQGSYCPQVQEICLKWLDKDQSSKANGGLGPLRCAEFKFPTKCLSKTKTNLHYCIDKFEWPNKEGSLPEVGFDWYGAIDRCESVGKRLCEENEWNFAAEGPSSNPYPTGYTRPTNQCNIDKPWLDYTKYKRSEWNQIYQGIASDSNSSCKSWAGIINLSGNVDEIINRPNGKPQYRNESTGGYWGPVRARVRPKTQVHNELFSDYQLGTRCCSNIK